MTQKGPAAAGPGPYGSIASNAAEAWPGAPSVPPLSRGEILAGCAAWAACPVDPLATSTPLDRLSSCIGQLVVPNGERAIPINVITAGANERAEHFVRCAADHAGDCGAVAACLTSRPITIQCQEDGCRALYDYEVTCDGTVATLATSGAPLVRDCALAFAECDPSSHTGCTDRPFSRCDPAIDRSDRCDGDVRLGCDGEDQVSYHDCAALGGTCGDLPSGGQGCLYPSSDDPPCGPADPECGGGTVSACILGQRVSMASADCP